MPVAMDASLYGAITFSSVADNIRVDLPACAASDTEITRYCKLVWHEMIHTYPALQRYFNESTGAIQELPDVAPETAAAFPVTMDDRRIAIEAKVRALCDVRSALKPEQLARLKVDEGVFAEEQGIKPAI